MCGLVGLFGKIDTVGLENFFEDLLIIDSVRGRDSTGVAILSNEKAKIKIIKGAVGPINIINSEQYEKAKLGHHLLMMGHNRAATIGKTTDKNAHPFRCKHITIAHNGTLLPGCEVLKENKFETDSEAIGHLIADQGIEKTYSKLDGAATLTYWDEKNKTFNIISDGKRPFYWAYSEDESVLFYASELWMLKVVSERQKEKFFKKQDTEIWYPAKHTLFSFRLKKDKVCSETKTLEEFKYTYNYRNYYGGYNRGFYNEWDDWDYNIIKNRGNIIPFNNRNRNNQNTTKIPERNFIPFSQTEDIFKKEYEHLLASKVTTEEEFKKHFKECFLCKENVSDSFDTTVIVNGKVAICRACVYTTYVNNIPLETVYNI